MCLIDICLITSHHDMKIINPFRSYRLMRSSFIHFLKQFIDDQHLDHHHSHSMSLDHIQNRFIQHLLSSVQSYSSHISFDNASSERIINCFETTIYICNSSMNAHLSIHRYYHTHLNCNISHDELTMSSSISTSRHMQIATLTQGRTPEMLMFVCMFSKFYQIPTHPPPSIRSMISIPYHYFISIIKQLMDHITTATRSKHEKNTLLNRTHSPTSFFYPSSICEIRINQEETHLHQSHGHIIIEIN